MTDRINPNIRNYLPNDPYYYGVDNLPFKDLISNDEALQFQLDQLKSQIDSLNGRNTFGDLKPYTDESKPGYVFVSPGSFIARVNIPADRDNGLRERASNGVHVQTDKVVQAQPESADYGLNSPDELGGVARTALVRVLSDNGVDPSIKILPFTTEDYPDVNSGSNPAPAYRLDVVFVQGYPAEDNDTSSKPTVGVMQGGWFMSEPEGIADDRKRANKWTGGGESFGRTLLQKTKDINQSNVIDEKKGNLSGGTDGLRYTTVPLPEDLRNFIYKPSIFHEGSIIQKPTFEDESSDFDESKIEAYLTEMADKKGIFCLPVCYVLVPFGYVGNVHIPNDNLMDIRPFFRTSEMTFDERQALAISYQPSFRNRFLTRKDPDYLELRDSWVRGSSPNSPGNHEGRLSVLESKTKQEIVFLEEERQLGGQLTGTNDLSPGTYMSPKADDIVALLIRVHVVGGAGIQVAEVSYENPSGNDHIIGRGGASSHTQTDSTVEYRKPANTDNTPIRFKVSGIGSGNARLWVYGYIRNVT